jgi:hypothetical protein
MIQFTQGDTAVLTLTAKDGDGNPFNITGATFTTYIKGSNGVQNSFPTGQHTIVDAPNGIFTLSLSATDTPKCGLGPNKTVITKIVQGSSVVHFRGVGILTVNSAAPSQ